MSDKSMMEVLVLAILVGVLLLLTQKPQESQLGDMAVSSALEFSQAEGRRSKSDERSKDP